MRIIDRLQTYFNHKNITAYSFERVCQVSNGYLKKQLKGKGSIGSDILLRINKNYPDLNLVWLITGNEEMLKPIESNEETRNMVHEDRQYYTKDERIEFLLNRITLLEASLADKEKIIALLEKNK